MKTIAGVAGVYVVVALVLAGCGSSGSSKRSRARTEVTVANPQPHVPEEPPKGVAFRPVVPNNFFTHTDAERILGEAAHRTDSTWVTGARMSHLTSSYTAYEEDDEGKLGVIYVVFEDYADTSSAHKKYQQTYEANKDHRGVDVLDDLGEEAYFHSDGDNFLFIMARKRGKVLTLKVNKITELTSKSAFFEVARKVVAGM